MKDPHDNLVHVHTNYKNYTDGDVNRSNPYKKEYLIILKDHVFACKATSRMNAIDLASMSDEFDKLMNRESLSNGRPINKYHIPNMNVIRIRPYHRGWWSGTDNITDEYIYVSLTNGRPTVYKGGSTILDLASSKGLIHKVRVYDYDNLRETELIV